MNDILTQIFGKLTTRFDRNPVPQEFEVAYREEINRITLQSARIGAILAGIIVPSYTVLDFFVNPDQLWLFVFMRAVSTLLFALLVLLSFLRLFEKRPDTIMAGVYIICGATIALMVRILGYETPYYAGMNLIYLGMMLPPWGLLKSLSVAMVVYSFYIMPILLIDMPNVELSHFVNNNVFQLGTITVAVAFNHFQYKRRRNDIVNRLTIARQAKELEERDKYKTQFIANIAHELKTPLSIVVGNAELIMEYADSPDQAFKDEIRRIQQAAFQLASHVDRITLVSTIDDPDANLDRRNYDYIGVVQHVADLFGSKAEDENIHLSVTIPNDRLVVNIDVIHIEEVLTNLIQNSFKFTQSGGNITVRVSSDGEFVFTEVEDSGAGIPEEHLEKIFDRLYQADEVLSKRHAGIGLGLYIVKKNVEGQGGKITVKSKVGEGTTFRFTLPLFADQSVSVSNQPYRGSERRKRNDRRRGIDRRAQGRRKRFEYMQSLGVDDLAKMAPIEDLMAHEDQNPASPSILIVEDNPGMMKVIVDALRDDYNLLLASDGFEALGKLESRGGDAALILSDIMMPGMSGFDFCKKVMEQEGWQHIPLIFITALMSEEDQLKGFELGATDYITKPYSIKVLKEKVAHWIWRRKYELLLQDMSKALENKVQDISRINDIIINEISNPLQVIAGADFFMERLTDQLSGASSEEEKQLLNYAKAITRAIDSINRVLEATRTYDNQAIYKKIPESVSGLFDEALGQMTTELQGIDLKIETNGVGGKSVLCDKRMLTQVFVNLLKNAVDAIHKKVPPEGGIIRIACQHAPEHHIIIRVTDNGIGIDPGISGQILKRKFSTKADGSGVGLQMSKMILKLHGGDLSFESEEGNGASFIIKLSDFRDEEKLDAVTHH